MLVFCITLIASAALSLTLIWHPPAATPAAPKRARPFRALSIVSADGGTCCPTCDALAGRRLLLRDAPKLPIAGCEAPQCACRYRHHGDRRERSPGRRLGDVGHFQPMHTGGERRRYAIARRHRRVRSTVSV